MPEKEEGYNPWAEEEKQKAKEKPLAEQYFERTVWAHGEIRTISNAVDDIEYSIEELSRKVKEPGLDEFSRRFTEAAIIKLGTAREDVKTTFKESVYPALTTTMDRVPARQPSEDQEFKAYRNNYDIVTKLLNGPYKRLCLEAARLAERVKVEEADLLLLALNVQKHITRKGDNIDSNLMEVIPERLSVNDPALDGKAIPIGVDSYLDEATAYTYGPVLSRTKFALDEEQKTRMLEADTIQRANVVVGEYKPDSN